jgi:uncharacterized RDD family membrane protein YckC
VKSGQRLESVVVSDGRWRYVLTVSGRDIEFGEGEVTLGRSRTATVRVEHESVSRSHALMTFERGNAILKDLNSSNGTFAGGKRILNETRLVGNETIQLGAAVVGFQVIPPDQPSERTTLLDTGVGMIPAPALSPEAPDEVSGDASSEARPPEGNPPADSAPFPAGSPDAEAAPLEISAGDLFQSSERREKRDEAPLVSQSALEAVRNVPDALPGFPAPSQTVPPPSALMPPSPAPARASLPPRPLRPSSVAEVAFSDYASRAAFPVSVPGAPAGFGQRLLAALVDGVILAAINLLLISPVILVSVFLGTQRDAASPKWEVLAITGLSGILIVAADLWYTVGGLARSGRTPGKALLKIAVVGPAGTKGAGIGYQKAFSRLFFQILGSIPVGLGTLVILFRKDRRAWHDLMSGTWVIRVG